GLAAQSVNILFQGCLSLARLRAPVSLGDYAISLRTAMNNADFTPLAEPANSPQRLWRHAFAASKSSLKTHYGLSVMSFAYLTDRFKKQILMARG
ncbi:MAG TPA: hypothetical protein VJL88_07875, partial [Nitrospira sp.]|nr:hypothetical protein [Nitrospira sp.]